MIVLSTAFKTAQIAISHNGKTSVRELDANCKHSENVLKTIDTMLDEMGVEIGEINTYGVVIGPGSFTGLRIGVALVKGLCEGGRNDSKVVPLSSFDVIAYSYIKHASPKSDFIVVINALSGLVFVRSYDNRGKALSEGKLISREELDSMSGNKICLEEDNLPFTIVAISAEDLLEYAVTQEKLGKSCDFHTVSPIYLRKSQAEDQLELKNLKKS